MKFPLVLFLCFYFASSSTGNEATDKLWDLVELFKEPSTYPAPSFGNDDLQAVFFEGVPFRGRATRVFAYYGLPAGATAQSPAPGVVCVHGGSGTAYAEWVRVWNQRGFAAIALDTNGAVPKSPQEPPDEFRHEWAGPQRYGFDQAQQPLQDHWNYHAIASVILAHSLLRSVEGVDVRNTGITGISWGGYKACIAVGLDHRFKFGAIVYGCGYLDQGTTWTQEIIDYGQKQWMKYWDPSAYLSEAKLPILWLNGTNDPHYHMPLFQTSALSVAGPSTFVIQPRMEHGHAPGWTPPEIYAFANASVGRGSPLIEVGHPRFDQTSAQVTFANPEGVALVSGSLLWTSDDGPWRERCWNSKPAEVSQDFHVVTTMLPANTKAFFFNLVDNRDLLVSSPYVELQTD